MYALVTVEQPISICMKGGGLRSCFLKKKKRGIYHEIPEETDVHYGNVICWEKKFRTFVCGLRVSRHACSAHIIGPQVEWCCKLLLWQLFEKKCVNAKGSRKETYILGLSAKFEIFTIFLQKAVDP